MASSTESQSLSSSQKAELILESFLSNAVWAVAIQPDDAVFETSFDRCFSRCLSENDNGIPTTFDGMKSTLRQIRSSVTVRRVLSESFLTVVDSNRTGVAGSVAHNFAFSGLQGDTPVVVKAIAVVKVVPVKNTGMQIVTESFVLKIE